MSISRVKGFTLIELLTVIAIISILAAMVMVVGPRIIEMAKMRRLDSALRQVATALTAYYTDNGTYPPAYGYVAFQFANRPNYSPASPAEEPGFYHLMPYMYLLQYHGNEGMYDEFSTSYETVDSGRLRLLEFSPRGELRPDGTYRFDWQNWPRYMGPGTPGLVNEINRQLDADKRPFIYLPVNIQQYRRAYRYWEANGLEFAQGWDKNDPLLENMQFPPRTYDAFVLVSVGPGGGTFGVIPEPLGVEAEAENNGRNLYHITALRAYFLATRDLNANGVLDFDFRARTQFRESGPEQTYSWAGKTLQNELPPDPGVPPFGYGPYIYASEWAGQPTR